MAIINKLQLYVTMFLIILHQTGFFPLDAITRRMKPVIKAPAGGTHKWTVSKDLYPIFC